MKSSLIVKVGICLSVVVLLCGCRSSRSSRKAATNSGLLGSRSVIPAPYSEPVKPSASAPKQAVSTPVETDDSFVPNESVEPLDFHPSVDKNTMVTPPPAPAATPAPAEAKEYIVQKGDVLSKIAVKQGVKMQDIVKANPGIDPNRLKVGQKIIISSGTQAQVSRSTKPAPVPILTAPNSPAPAKKSTATKGGKAKMPADGIYTAVSGDNLSVIAHRFNVKISDLRTWNNLTSDKVKIGQKFKVRSDAQLPATKKIDVKKEEKESKSEKKAAEKNSVGDSSTKTAPAQSVVPDVLIDDAKEQTAPTIDAVTEPLPVVEEEPIDAPPMIDTPAPAPAPEAFEYKTFPRTITAPDTTLESLSKEYGVTVEEILKHNPQIKSNADLRVGESVVIPYRD